MRFPLDLWPRRSRILLLLTAAVHALAVASVIGLPWPLPYRLLLLAAIAFSAWQVAQRSPVSGLRLSGDGALGLFSRDGTAAGAAVEADSAVFSALVVLRARDAETGRLHTLVLLPDSLSPENFRLLRVWLRWRTERHADKS